MKCDKKQSGTIGEYVDLLADGYFAKGIDAFTANILALKFALVMLDLCQGKMSELISRVTSPKEVSGDA